LRREREEKEADKEFVRKLPPKSKVNCGIDRR